MTFNVRFWGVRGSIACPSPDHVKYGGNTSCLEVVVGDNVIVLDAGTGIRDLGGQFLKRGVLEAYLLLTHTHWDHINGFPFFTPAYDPNRTIHIKAGHLAEIDDGIQGALSAQMESPMFPVPLEAMQAKMNFEDFTPGDTFDLYGDVHVLTAPLNHPNGATGYRIEYAGKSLCYVTDTEHVAGSLDPNILGLIENTDLVIYDSMYTEEEYATKVGWGHSTWNEGVKLCREANAKQMAIFHHEPDHTDDIMDAIGTEAKKEWDGCFVAREGMIIELD